MSRYAELKRKGDTAPADGIFYAFSDEQFAKGLVKCGYTQADVDSGKIVADGFGGYGSMEAFDKRSDFYAKLHERIMLECTPNEIFSYEYFNYECNYTDDISEALKVAQSYFPQYKPSKRLLNELKEKGVLNV